MSFRVVSQIEIYKENTWSSVIWKHRFSAKWSVATDFGYRWFDHYFKQRRQDLIRVFVDRKINEKSSIGLGFACFESINKNSKTFNTEFRPYFQYQLVHKKGKSTFGMRFRNELRYYYTKNEYIDRSRLQLSYEYKIVSKFLVPKMVIEGFVSAQKTPLIEQRYTIGNTFSFNETLSLNLFYTLQFQSNIILNNRPVSQNIIGFQIILNTFNNDKQ